jgi:hypothetical protein
VVPNDVLLAWERVRDTVAGHIDRLLDRREISEPRRELARALLSLEIADADALRALLRL